VPTSTKQSVTPCPPVKSRNAARSTYLGDSTIASGSPMARQVTLNRCDRSALGQISNGFHVMAPGPLADICCVQAQPRDGRDMALQLHHFYRPKRRKA
jgi:hypothetical protein